LDGRELHVVGHYRLGQPFERKLADFFERCCRFHTGGDPLGDEDLPILRAEPTSQPRQFAATIAVRVGD